MTNQITHHPSQMDGQPLSTADRSFLKERLTALLTALREEGDPTLLQFLTDAHWEVPMESWAHPQDTSASDSRCPTAPSQEC